MRGRKNYSVDSKESDVEELLNGTLENAVEKLAAYAADLRTRPRTYAEKQATSTADFLTSLGDKLKENPGLGGAMLGGGLGAGLGGISAAYGNRDKDPVSKRSILGSMLTGGIAGAGVGAGAGLAHKGLSGVSGITGGMGSDALKPGEFTDPATGQTMQIDPTALKDNPELHKQIRSLTTPSLQSTVAGGASALWDKIKQQVPTSAAILPWVGGADLALHAPGIGLGRIDANAAGGRIGSKLFSQGLRSAEGIDPALQAAMGKAPGGTMPKELPGGKGWVEGSHVAMSDRINPRTYIERQINKLRGAFPKTLGRPNPKTLGDLLGERHGPGVGEREVAKMTYTPVEERELTDKSTSPEEKFKKRHVMPAKQLSVTEKLIGDTKEVGHQNHPTLSGRQLYRLPGTNITYAGAKSLGGGALMRLAGYGLPIAGEYMARGMSEDLDNQQTLRDLIAKHAKPIPKPGG